MLKKEIKLALIQSACGPDVQENEDRTLEQIEIAAAQGANIVCLQELFNAIYFCQYVDVRSYKYAQTFPNSSTDKLQMAAKRLGIVLVVPFFEEALPGVYFNSAVVYDSDGTYLGNTGKIIFRRARNISRNIILLLEIWVTPSLIPDSVSLVWVSAGISGFRK